MVYLNSFLKAQLGIFKKFTWFVKHWSTWNSFVDKIVFLFNFYHLKRIKAYLTIPKLSIETENYGILGSFYQEINSFCTKYTKNFVNHTNKKKYPVSLF